MSDKIQEMSEIEKKSVNSPRKNKRKAGVFNIILFILLALFSLVLIVLLFWSLVASLTDGDFYELENVKYGFPIKYFTVDNYISAYQNLKVTLSTKNGNTEVYTMQLLLNSFIYSVGSAGLITFVTCTVAYLTSKYPFKPSKIIYNVVLVVMIVPIVGELPSMVQMLTRIGLYDNLLGMFLMRASFTNMYFLVFYAYFKGVPWSYGESAFIDGVALQQVVVDQYRIVPQHVVRDDVQRLFVQNARAGAQTAEYRNQYDMDFFHGCSGIKGKCSGRS